MTTGRCWARICIADGPAHALPIAAIRRSGAEADNLIVACLAGRGKGRAAGVGMIQPMEG